MFGRGGKGMGGGPGGANMLRAVGRAAVSRASSASFQEPLSSSTSSATRRHNNNTSNGHLYLPSSSSSGSSSLGSCSSINDGLPITANNWPSFSGSPCFDDFEWVSIDTTLEQDNRQPHDFVLGPVPCVAEVENALSALQNVVGASSSRELIRDKFPYNVDEETGYHSPSSDIVSVHRVRSTGSEFEWIEPSMQLYDTRVYQNSVYDALHLLQTDSLIQKMVMSISSDEAIWNAVLNNEVVKELRKSYCAAEDSSGSLSFDESSGEKSDESSETMNINIVKWIFDSTRGKILEVFDKLTKLFSGLFKLLPPSEETGTADTFDAKLRISMVLSVLVLFIVGVARARTH
ncbi:uncharacterized protein LOC120181300 [Hibiscus syriacus]|uniref:uncharacterized protein LOC120181300 n=1 Tax=Hibiscus syriacus TaxID=106335 RepID=UPI001922ABBD|nr:uncharacterized protein LOC120181300 [Hibiscus syriacus]